jgi:hypothetical protein
MERQMGKGNFTKVDNYIFEEGRYLTPNAKLVYIVLLSFRNNKTGKTFPSYDKIMAKSGLSRNKVAAALNELEYFLWISRKKVFIGGNHYYVAYPADKEYKLITEWPSKEVAKEYAQKVKDNKRRYGVNPWCEEEPPAYTGKPERLDDEEWDDDQIPY